MKKTSSINFQQEVLEAIKRDAAEHFRSNSSIINEVMAGHYGLKQARDEVVAIHEDTKPVEFDGENFL